MKKIEQLNDSIFIVLMSKKRFTSLHMIPDLIQTHMVRDFFVIVRSLLDKAEASLCKQTLAHVLLEYMCVFFHPTIMHAHNN